MMQQQEPPNPLAQPNTIFQARQTLTGMTPGDPNAAKMFLSQMDPGEYKERNRVETRQYGRLKAQAKNRPMGADPYRRTAGLGSKPPIFA